MLWPPSSKYGLGIGESITGKHYDEMVIDDLWDVALTRYNPGYNPAKRLDTVHTWVHNFCKENTMPKLNQRFIDISPEEYKDLKIIAKKEPLVATFIKRVLEVIDIDLEPDFGQNDN